MKSKVTKIISTCVPMPDENIDTDQIIPARFLKSTTREGFGKNLFRDWRYDAANKPIKDFILNDPKYKGQILVAGRNFGCGSSREHAAWALVDYGFKAVISSFFADIFKSNALNNSLLPIQISEDELQQIFQFIKKDPKVEFVIDLQGQRLSAMRYPLSTKFEINAYKKMTIMNGYDDIEYLRSMQKKTEEFESNRKNDYSIDY
ncbi:3-isopropylmalate dehydratase small subunit [Candidatus Roizmanbacteria bacterium RIFCSPLOWO2_01_FULL_38_12]|uniref:3-isopropylmalate dehydratase small subunit n=1 Tax=Candidatus Roizmanbacteria bacterium RIFCSPLOWO2_01_FULL_38_12 TaxID=1802061 RepID=A0A1F7IR94_9BACT|nr:MAG: 3-isopropylmalate dehydratase small subunit [Candidatus Roizmanbacteria bacterium RIFCSPHIGHO2_01_FULL_38_15]OGK35409.1 MAG: 3-isopropylmalate dehydratase small subunit [Candidatus Roizmanbacteria bacterium RIFCSPHIGHO2_12_FULL_38_13]OGK45885.1 MAG: 3-isopropylmalate dehydratase small subunit [Candidatus Roizmanbacteria bacterium RIFCSPLOWO2_01_FULL_38_12]